MGAIYRRSITLYMKSFLLLLLTSNVNNCIGSTYCISSIFTFGGEPGCMEDLPYVDCVHSFLQGEYFEGSCADVDIEVGTCCVPGASVCRPTTSGLCLLFLKGTWSTEGNCSECPIYHSCCLNQTCTEEYTEEQCIDKDGKYMDYPCVSGKCLIQEKYNGACCQYDECYHLPQIFCPEVDTWTKGKNCSESGCGTPFVDVFNPPVNTTSPGRCCHFYGSKYCFENEYTEQECIDRGDLWESGLGCDNPFTYCYQRGACYKDGLCIGEFSKTICDIYGGAFTNGGVCNVLPTAACFSEDRCNEYDSIQCELIGGFYDNTTEECPINPGACCSDTGCTDELYSSFCNFLVETWIPNGTCDTEDICSVKYEGAACCFKEFCLTSPKENYCTSISVQNNMEYTLFEKNTCPLSGTCSSLILLDQELVYVDFISDISVRNISLTIQNNSSIVFDKLVVDNSLVVISNSNFLSNGTFSIYNSTLDLFFRLGNDITVGGCLVGDSSTYVSIDLDASHVSNTSDWRLDIIQYECLEGSINLAVTINGFYSECYIATPGLTSLFVTYSDICVQDIEETTNSYATSNPQKDGLQFGPTAGIFITVAGIVVVVIACLLVVYIFKRNRRRAMASLKRKQNVRSESS
eukprot:TRINITY_DN4639_c0_g1_i4.p1 TRINITY_DN4639_c0_g1~~TRINITY_DN4639_c0_g1_i4.p1  ORF type:complete len:634 (+),score=96.23 TRINITY_DN4639_c0_g1_i4:205-2106(+)